MMSDEVFLDNLKSAVKVSLLRDHLGVSEINKTFFDLMIEDAKEFLECDFQDDPNVSIDTLKTDYLTPVENYLKELQLIQDRLNKLLD